LEGNEEERDSERRGKGRGWVKVLKKKRPYVMLRDLNKTQIRGKRVRQTSRRCVLKGEKP